MLQLLPRSQTSGRLERIIGVQHGGAFCASRHACRCSQRFTLYSVPSFRRVFSTVHNLWYSTHAAFPATLLAAFIVCLCLFVLVHLGCRRRCCIFIVVSYLLCASIGYLFRTCVCFYRLLISYLCFGCRKWFSIYNKLLLAMRSV